jgi:molybdenum cofactor cytidylyltransferase
MRRELKNLDVKIAANANWAEGMSSSIRLGLESLEDVSSVTAAVITLCDQPFVSPQTIDELIDA